MIDRMGYTPKELGVTSSLVLKLTDLRFYSVRQAPFRMYGLLGTGEGERYHRIPYEVAEATSEGVKGLNFHTSGGRVRFVTDSRYLAIHVVNPAPTLKENMTTIATSGFDVYVRRNGRETFAGVFKPPVHYQDGYSGVVHLPEGEKEITVNFPLWCGCREVYLGFEETSTLSAHPDYRYEKPILYYGSSITQGGSASRPGLSYPSLIGRRLDTNFINLGFSGAARGEDAIGDYMAGLDYSVFVLDYDHNAPSVEHLEQTHEKLYLKIRAAHPDIPILLIGKPDCTPIGNDAAKRRDVIYQTYRNAKMRGEKVIFVDGYSLFAGELREECTVDGCHPNDLGLTRMADVIGKCVDYALSWA